MPKRLPEEKVNDFKQALTGSTSTYDIAKEVGVHESTVSRYSRRLFSNRTMGSAGRPTLVSKVTKRLIKRKVIEGVLKTAKEVHRELVQLGYDISYQSAIKINVWGADGGNYYWKRPSGLFQHCDLKFTVKHRASKLMTIYSDVYQHNLNTTLRDTMEHYNFDWSNIYFQHDNDPKHKAKSTIAWLDNHQVRYISDWPAQSPDLNPIEHVWHPLKLNLSCYERRAKNTDELWERHAGKNSRGY
ncbi:hypothetical protein G6F19_013206 [Rhizopus arrhizus]|nr:hypothetical protein G6F19_013206 [Rhizopus arrhizus]KAG0927423.1 hypothetical protein G6F32_012893 [Rhizopus arrhizus]KAG1089589.1 hypothetical protein G6F40_013278 [Rhizopus arrhizus]